MASVRTVLFLCPHGAAKSVIAAAYFQRLVDRRGLPYRADAAGTEPELEVNPAVVSALAEERLHVAGLRPRRVTYDDLTGARRVVSIGCDLRGLLPDGSGVVVDRWDDVPPVSQDLPAARSALAARVAALVDALERDEPASGAVGAGRDQATEEPTQRLGPFVAYFLWLGTFGFGGPIALAGFMHRDLVERRRWVSEDDYQLSLALAQIMPGPLAAQLAIAIGYFRAGVLGATAVGLAFILPSFLMVVVLSWLYVRFGGLWWMQALFYGIGAAVIGIIAIAAYKLARSTNRRDPLLWGIFAALAVITVWAEAELGEFFILAGLIVLFVRATPSWIKRLATLRAVLPAPLALALAPATPAMPAGAAPTEGLLLQILLFFTKAGAFVFGSGLAIVPFLHQGVVQQYGWLTEHQFLDAVAVAMITPGPVVITVAFVGYLVAGLAGAVVAALGIFLPVYFFTIVPAPWFRRHRDNPQLKAFVRGATAATTGAISGAVIILAGRAIVDLPTAAIALGSLALLWRVKVPEPLLVLAAGAAGLVLWPLMHGAG